MMRTVFARLRVILTVFLILSVSGVTQAVNLISNGNFATNPPYSPGLVPNKYIYNTDPTSIPTNWIYDGGLSTGGIAAVYASGTADSIGAQSVNGIGYLWGPANPAPGGNSLNGLPAQDPFAPTGSNFLASDSDPLYSRAISQNVSAVTNGVYELSFGWAAAQFREVGGLLFNGPTMSRWTVSLGSQTVLVTAYESIPDHGFSGWKKESVTFTYNGPTSSAVSLSFLADGAPGGLPPVALLSNVALNTVPEPGSLMIVGVGLLASVTVARLRAKSASV